MKRTGEILKKAREEKKLSLHEVALFLKINSRVLQAIEDGDQSQLPARTFLRGFVQSYAKFLKLDPQLVLQIFSEETAPPAPNPIVDSPHVSTLDVKEKPVEVEAPPMVEAKPTAEDRTEVDVISLEKSILTQSQDSQDKLGFKTIAVSVLGLLLVVVLYFANSVIKKYQKEAEVDPVDSIASVENQAEQSEDSGATTEPTTTTEPVASVAAPASAPVVAAPAQAPANTTVTVATPIVSPITLPKPVVAVTPVPAPAPVAAPVVVAKPAVTTPPPAAATTTAAAPATVPPVEEKKPEGKLIEVIVEANDSVEIEYSSAKTSPQKMILKADQIHTFKSRSGVRLKISNGGAVNIIMNGRDLGAPGAAGQPTQVAY